VSKSHSNPVRLVAHMLAAVLNSRAVFHREWKRYQAPGLATDGIAGRWMGEWVSERSGHRGELKCVLSPVSGNVYRACFYATFSLLFRVGYVTELRADKSDKQVLLKGEADLGALAGGVYRCEGELTGTAFNCRYSCKYDEGVFHLKRLD
jgi:hypothetical protein